MIVQTYFGFRFQKVILQKGAELLKTECRAASAMDESMNIDGYIGNIPVSIKPETYRIKGSLREKIEAKIIYYKKVRGGIEVDFGELIH